MTGGVNLCSVACGKNDPFAQTLPLGVTRGKMYKCPCQGICGNRQSLKKLQRRPVMVHPDAEKRIFEKSVGFHFGLILRIRRGSDMPGFRLPIFGCLQTSLISVRE
jgi:hypothetical protein